jgi:hypothetical protein
MTQGEPKFDHSAIEKDIERLSSEIKTEGGKEREALKAALGARIYREEKWVDLTGKAAQPSPPPNILPNYVQNAPAQTKLVIEKLLDLAWHKGVAKAAQEAKKHGPLILDAFHDAITDKLYEEFKNRGLI